MNNNQIKDLAILKFKGGKKGSVLMEYVIVQTLVACLLMIVMNSLFYNWATAEFGPVGAGIKYFYQRLLGGLSLPVP